MCKFECIARVSMFLIALGTLCGEGAAGQHDAGAATRQPQTSCVADPASEFRITVDPTVGIYGLDLDGDIAVWRDNRRGGGGSAMDIYGYDLNTKTEFPVAIGGELQRATCRISGRLVAWTEYDAEFSVWCKDIQGGSPVRLVGPSAVGSWTVDMAGHWLVWSQKDGGSDYNLYGARLALDGEGNPLCSVEETFDIASSSDQEWGGPICGDTLFYVRSPHIWEWEGERNWDIWKFDFVTRTGSPLLTGPENQYPQGADGDTLLVGIYGAYGTPTSDQYAYTISTGVMSPLIATVRGAGVSGDIVVYRDGDSKIIHAYNVLTGSRFQVSSTETAADADHEGPLVSGNNVIWKLGIPPATYLSNFLYGNTLSCEPSSIPAVSQWGVCVTTLLLLLAAKIVFIRRRRACVARVE